MVKRTIMPEKNAREIADEMRKLAQAEQAEIQHIQEDVFGVYHDIQRFVVDSVLGTYVRILAAPLAEGGVSGSRVEAWGEETEMVVPMEQAALALNVSSDRLTEGQVFLQGMREFYAWTSESRRQAKDAYLSLLAREGAPIRSERERRMD